MEFCAAYQTTLTFDQYPFNFRSTVHVNWDGWISLHPKKAILPTFLGQTPNCLGEKQKKKIEQPTPLESWVCYIFLEPKVGVLAYTKSGEIICSTLWQSNVHCILQGLPLRIGNYGFIVVVFCLVINNVFVCYFVFGDYV